MQTAVKYGIIAGMLSGTALYAEFYSGIMMESRGIYSFMFTLLLLIGFIYTAIFKAYKNSGHLLSQLGGLREGLKVSAVAALFIALFTFIFHQFIVPDFIDLQIEEGIKQMRIDGVDEASIEKARKNFERMYSPLMEIAKALLRTILLGAVFSFVIALLVRNMPQKGKL